ncbi:MAG: ABC transporter permease [Acidobacteriota bacterium]
MLHALLTWVRRWFLALIDAARLSLESVWANRLRSALAISGVVIGIVTVVMVASVLSNLRDQVALLFRELGTENVFAYHLSGDPYQPPTENELSRKPLKPEFAKDLLRLGASIREVAVQILVPTIVNGIPLTARSGPNESDTVLVEGVSANFFEVVGAEFRQGRPFTELEDRSGARVAVVGASLSKALFGSRTAVGRPLVLAGETYTVVGELAARTGAFFGENRQDRVLAIPAGAARKRFSGADRTVLYIRAKAGRLEETREEAEFILRRLRGLAPGQADDFNLSTAESIIRTFDELSAQIGIATLALAGLSLLIGGIGIANVMVISVTERTREIGVRLAIGARRIEVQIQFLIESGILAVIGGVAGVSMSLLIGLGLKSVLEGFSAVPPLWAVVAGVAASLAVGVMAGYWPARRAARLDPVAALRHE